MAAFWWLALLPFTYGLSNLFAKTGGSFAVNLEYNPDHVPNGPAQYARSMTKWSGEHIVRVAGYDEKIPSGDLEAFSQDNDVEYLSYIGLGTPYQQLFLDLDTGSADLWVFSDDQTFMNITEKGIYQPNKSSTATRIPGSTWKIRYGDGSSAAGHVWKDVIKIAGIEVPDVYIQTASSASGSMLSDKNMSGIFGLARNLNTTVKPRQPPVISQLRGYLNEPLFTVDFRYHETGKYEFGALDRQLYNDSNLHWTTLDPESQFWNFSMKGVHVGGQNYWLEWDWPVIADTGTTLMILADELALEYYNSTASRAAGARQSQGIDEAWIFPCANASLLPDYHISFNNSDEWYVTIPAKYLNFTELRSEPGFCYGGIQGNQGMDFSILGDIFLKSLFAVFDLGSDRIGFADKVI